MSPPAPRVLAISPPRPGPWLDQVPLLAAAGVDGLCLRLVDAAEALQPVARRLLAHGAPGLSLLVRPCRPGDVALARELGLGLHLPAHLDPAQHRDHPGLRSAACHDLAALRRARDAGCDFALLSPVFPPGSKPGDLRPVLGLDGLAHACRAVDLPVLALGGIDPERARACRRAGAHGVAAIGALFEDDAVRPEAAAALVRAVTGSDRDGPG